MSSDRLGDLPNIKLAVVGFRDNIDKVERCPTWLNKPLITQLIQSTLYPHMSAKNLEQQIIQDADLLQTGVGRYCCKWAEAAAIESGVPASHAIYDFVEQHISDLNLPASKHWLLLHSKRGSLS
jgi:hypothetical protein